MACNRCVRVDRSALALGLGGVGGAWGGGGGGLGGVVTAINYAIQCISVSGY